MNMTGTSVSISGLYFLLWLLLLELFEIPYMSNNYALFGISTSKVYQVLHEKCQF